MPVTSLQALPPTAGSFAELARVAPQPPWFWRAGLAVLGLWGELCSSACFAWAQNLPGSVSELLQERGGSELYGNPPTQAWWFAEFSPPRTRKAPPGLVLFGQKCEQHCGKAGWAAARGWERCLCHAAQLGSLGGTGDKHPNRHPGESQELHPSTRQQVTLWCPVSS